MKQRPKAILQRFYFGLDIIFALHSFCLPFVLRLIFNLNFSETTCSYGILLAVWVLIRLCFSRINVVELSKTEIGFIILCICVVCHFYFFSPAHVYHHKFWDYLIYVSLFFIYRWLFKSSPYSAALIKVMLFGIVFFAVFQAIYGAFQYFEIIAVKNRYFRLLGAFSSPNYLALYLAFGLIILVWDLSLKKYKLGLYLFFSFGIISLTGVIVLSKSRGSWLAFVVGLCVLLFTSNKGISLLKRIDLKKGFLMFLFLVALSIFSSNFLYRLKPDSVKGRALVAKISLNEIKERPLRGYGLFSFAGVYNNAKANYFMDAERSWDEIEHATYVFNPFNDYILFAFELGLPLMLGFVFLVFYAIRNTALNSESRLGIALISILGVWAMFNAASEKIAIMAVAIFGLVLIFKNSTSKPIIKWTNRTHVILKTLLTATSVLVIYFAIFKMDKALEFKNFKDLKSEADVNQYLKLVQYADFSFENAMAVGLKFKGADFDSLAIDYLETAFQNTSAPKIGKMLALFYLNENNYKSIEDIYTFNKHVEPYRYDPKIGLLNFYNRLNRYDDLMAISQEIVDLPVKIPSKKVDDYKAMARQKIKFYAKYIDTTKTLKGSLSAESTIKSKILGRTLPYKIYLPPVSKIENKLPVIFVNDGYSYVRSGLPELMDGLITTNQIPPMAAVFLDPRDKQQNWKNVRQKLFLCNPKYVDFFIKEFMPMLEKRYPLSDKREDRTILGLSFGGLAAAYFGETAPAYFKNIAMQSPAFHPCPDIYTSYKKNPKKDLKIYLSYGTGKDTENQDIPFIKILQQKKYPLKVDRVVGGNHEWAVWKDQLVDILIYFFGRV